jgi:hypothetical protein
MSGMELQSLHFQQCWSRDHTLKSTAKADPQGYITEEGCQELLKSETEAYGNMEL